MRSASQSSMRSNRSGIGIAGCKPSLTPLPPDPASLVRTEYEAAASALDARTAAWYRRTGTAVPVGAPTAVDILASFPPICGLVFGSTAWGGSREVGVLLKPPCSGCVPASSSAQRQWRSLGARSMLDAIPVKSVPGTGKVENWSGTRPAGVESERRTAADGATLTCRARTMNCLQCRRTTCWLPSNRA